MNKNKKQTNNKILTIISTTMLSLLVSLTLLWPTKMNAAMDSDGIIIENEAESPESFLEALGDIFLIPIIIFVIIWIILIIAIHRNGVQTRRIANENRTKFVPNNTPRPQIMHKDKTCDSCGANVSYMNGSWTCPYCNKEL